MSEDKVQEKPKTTSATVREIGVRLAKNEHFALSCVLVALVAGFGVMTRGSSITLRNAANILLQSSTRGLAAIGQAFVILTAGIDLSVGGIATLTMIVGSTAMVGRSGFPVGPIALMLLIGLGVGLGNGILVSRVGIPPLIVTLAVWQVMEGSAWLYTSGLPIYEGIPRGLAFLGQGRVGLLPVPAIIFMAAAMVAYFVLNHVAFGRRVYAVGGNRVSAWLSGVNVPNSLLVVYSISGFCAALTGVVIMSRIMMGSLIATGGLELDSIAAVVIGGVGLGGGRGSLIGVLMGVFIITIINNGMNLMVVPAAFQKVVRGLIIIIAVAIDYWRKR